MMYQQIIARRYAKGLMLCVKDDSLLRIESELKSLVDVMLSENRDLYRLFDDPAFSPLEKKAVINRIAKMAGMSPILCHFLLLLVDKDRIMLLPIIYESLTAFLDERSGRVRAKIKSATPLTDQEIKAIESSLVQYCQKDVLFTTEIGSELLGGIRVEVGGLIFDGTVKAKLDAIKNQLVLEAGII